MIQVDTQLGFDDIVQIKEDAIDRVEENANARWLEGAYQIAVGIAQRQRRFTTDDVWAALAHTDLVTHEHRGMGAVTRRIQREGIAWPTGEYIPSVRAVRHRGPIQVWQSHLYWPSVSLV